MTTSSAQTPFEITDNELLAVENLLLDAFETRSVKDLKILGFGEIGVPLAWPQGEPSMCVKRLCSSKSPADIESLLGGVRQYVAALERHVAIVPTELRTIENVHGMSVAYLLQPLLPSGHLLENVLRETTPTAHHPAVVAVRDVVVASVADRTATIDSQLSNFTWTGDHLAFFDVGTPFMVDSDGHAKPLTGALMNPIPAVMRAPATKMTTKVSNEFASKRGNLRHAAISVARMGLDDWIGPVVTTFNEVLEEQPLSTAEIRSELARLHKDMKQLKGLMKMQRSWATKVRRQPFDYFITDSFTGEIL